MKINFVFLGPGKFQLDDVQSALSLCTHLIYGFAGINAETFEVVPLKPSLDTGVGYSYYKLVTQLKRTFPNLKIYLSIGGNADPDDETHKYLVLVSVYTLFYETRFGESYEYIPLRCGDGHFLLPFNFVNDSNLIKNNNNNIRFIQTETSQSRSKFINSVNRLLNDYDFDGIDLAWQFPPAKVKKERGTFGSIWHGIKKTFGYGKFKDDKEVEHRDGFTILVRDLKAQLRSRLKDLTVGVLPHVNSSGEYRFFFSQNYSIVQTISRDSIELIK